MRLTVAAFLLLLVPPVAFAQNLTSQALTDGAFEVEPLLDGGTGGGRAVNTQFLIAGVRFGKVLTGDHLGGWFRGNFEYAGEALPLYLVMQPGGTVYGGSFKPIILEWNFTSHRKFAPYALIAGGVLFTTSNVPPGNTSAVNFTPQAAFGFRIFRRPKHSWDIEVQGVHHSNASLGTFNPGLNGSVMISIGYSWFK
jgi:lipid A 3-O-deacylase